MLNESPTVIIGKLGAAHGIKGFVKVQSFTRPASNLFDYQPWYIEKDDSWEKISIDSLIENNQKWLVKLSGCQDRNQAETLSGKRIAICRNQLPSIDDESYYWQDLVGLTVLNNDNCVLGVVDSLMETGAHDVLVIKRAEKKDLLIPFVLEHAVKAVLKDEGKILVDWPGDSD